MTSNDKTENIEKKRGRPKKPKKSVSVHTRVKGEFWLKLRRHAIKMNFYKNGEPNISAAFIDAAEKGLEKY